MTIQKSDIVSFTYDGSDDMIDLKTDKVPKTPHKNFKSMLKLKDGSMVVPPDSWMKKIWNWWYNERRNELITKSNHVMVDVANSMLNQKHKIPYRDE